VGDEEDMEEQVVLQILELLQTMQDACQELYTSVEIGNKRIFDQLCHDMSSGLLQVLQAIDGHETAGNQQLFKAGKSILDSIRRVKEYFRSDRETCLRKIEFEVLPLLQEAYGMYYFFQYLADHPERLPEYYAKERNLLFSNEYVNDALEHGQFKYEASIYVMAYNKLEYTKICVESLLKNLPANLNYELILVNHGSTDGTKEYFESIHPNKQLDIAVNGGGAGAIDRIFEGEFLIGISNDIVVMPHAIENMLACIRSDSRIAWVVPTTPNISNFQTIPACYSSLEELTEFARQNNCQDSYRWEQRVRLCNPIHIMRASVFHATKGLCVRRMFHTTHPIHAFSFPDDRVSLLLRRNGYKMMLAKDAYCHHFGSVTLKDEIRQQNEQKYYTEGRIEFQKAFGVDPWGPGFCYDPVFMRRVVEDEQGHIKVLGINCGLGSNPLKVKEQIKEYCHNTDCKLSFITDNSSYFADLVGIGDETKIVLSIEELKLALSGDIFQYIIWELPFLPKYEFELLLKYVKGRLAPFGKLLIKLNDQNRKILQRDNCKFMLLGDDWFMFRQEELGLQT